MYMKKFYSILHDLRDKGYRPYLDSFGSIRLRLNRRCYCPITALYHAMTGKHVVLTKTRLAIRGLGLRPDAGDNIISHSDGRRGIVRKRIISALELKEVSWT